MHKSKTQIHALYLPLNYLEMRFDWCRCCHGSSFTRNQRQTWQNEAWTKTPRVVTKKSKTIILKFQRWQIRGPDWDINFTN